ncbi:hypothetical protein [Actinomadura rupiterrae]|uniref:hypothetical protein n=1 Tax=Actinomadura rupiterrae TaxID=559627 RepID=UPI0020A426B4|nr:hypothetical protein [Actinomadura rupiterrae]MCP2339597.1 hypothetical protein [Actinomadura rupiterrae]
MTVVGRDGDSISIIIDPATGRLLARRTTAGATGPLPRGSDLLWSVLIKAGWTDTAPKGATILPG